MWKDFIKGMKMLKYGEKAKQSMGFGVMFFVLGVIFVFTDRMFTLGSAYVPLGISYFFSSIVATLEYSNLVASSPSRFGLSVRSHDVGILLTGFLSYLIVAAVLWLRMKYFFSDTLDYEWQLLYLIAMVFWIQIYIGVATKLFAVVIVCFTGVVLVNGGVNFILKQYIFNVLGFEEVMLSGLVVVIAGAVLSGVLRRLVYKRPLSRWAAGTELRKGM